MNPRAATNDLLPFQGSPFSQLGYFSKNGEGGIRTHAPFRTNGFQDRLVMTASISLQTCFSIIQDKKRFVKSFLIYFFLFFLTLLLFISSSVIISWLEVYVNTFFIFFQKLFQVLFQTLLNIQKCPGNDQIFRCGYLYIIIASLYHINRNPHLFFNYHGIICDMAAVLL